MIGGATIIKAGVAKCLQWTGYVHQLGTLISDDDNLARYLSVRCVDLSHLPEASRCGEFQFPGSPIQPATFEARRHARRQDRRENLAWRRVLATGYRHWRAAAMTIPPRFLPPL